MKEDIYYFEDWVSNMLNSSDYTEWELMDFEEYYHLKRTQVYLLNNLKSISYGKVL